MHVLAEERKVSFFLTYQTWLPYIALRYSLTNCLSHLKTLFGEHQKTTVHIRNCFGPYCACPVEKKGMESFADYMPLKKHASLTL